MKKRLSLKELEIWKRKAMAFDKALSYLDGRASTEEAQHALYLLKQAMR